MNNKKNKGVKTRSSAVTDLNFTAAAALISVILFFGVLAGGAIATAVSEKEDFSQIQNRYLARFPEFTVKKLLDGSFTSGIESYMSDHFAGQEKWISAKTNIELMTGKREVNDIYILKDRLAEKISEPDMTKVNKSIDGIKQFSQDNGVTPFIMLIPTQAEIYRSELPMNAPNPDQQQFINGVYSALGDSAVSIDAYSVLSANKDDYIYYRTDHHWTTRGAFLAYTAAAKKMGYTPLTESDYDIEHASDSFRGTFYSKVLYDRTKADTLDIWHPSAGEKDIKAEIYSTFGEEPEIHEGMYFKEYLDVKDKYSTFLGTNQPMIRLRTGNSGGKLLIFKDSYAHCCVPFLTSHYSEICMIDLRYIQISYKTLIDVSEYDQVLFLYNVSTFMSDENIKKLMIG